MEAAILLCLSLLTDRKPSHIFSNGRMICAKYEVPGKTRLWKPRYGRKVLPFPNNVPFIIDQLQPNVNLIYSMHCKCGEWRFKKIQRMEAEIEKKRYIVLQVKYPSLLTDRNRAVVLCSACVETAKGNVAGKSIQWKPKHRTTVSLFTR
jgi:hypothetical protein